MAQDAWAQRPFNSFSHALWDAGPSAIRRFSDEGLEDVEMKYGVNGSRFYGNVCCLNGSIVWAMNLMRCNS